MAKAPGNSKARVRNSRVAVSTSKIAGEKVAELMKKRYFIKNLTIFILPLLVPLVILGALSITITEQYIKTDINKNVSNLLKQTRDNVELMFSEMDAINLIFSANPQITVNMKRVTKGGEISLEDYRLFQLTNNFIASSVNAKPYIHSIYIYYENPEERFFTTTEGLVSLGDFYDREWYDSFINYSGTKEVWTETRAIKQYAFEKKPTNITTVYKKLHTTGKAGTDGVIVLNIYTGYFENRLNSLWISPRESILVLDEQGIPVFTHHYSEEFNSEDLKRIAGNKQASATLVVNNRMYALNSLQSEKFGWQYISIVPTDQLYQIPIKLTTLTGLLVLLSLCLGMVIIYFLTKRNYRHLENIIGIIDRAEKGQPLLPLPSRVKDEYGYIMSNILKTFIEQSYLKIQLSERRYRLKTMELTALQSQINPHFLFNTLKTIYWKSFSMTNQPNEVCKMIDSLSDILDYSLSDPEKIVSLREEIDMTSSYLDIQKIRYRDKFEVVWDCEEPLKEEKVIKLILQPLVENSIYHGVKEKNGKSIIKIKVAKWQGRIRIAVVDSGIGLKREALEEIKRKLEYETGDFDGIGLMNTVKRLRLTYGDGCKIKINSKHGWGTAVYIYIPL